MASQSSLRSTVQKISRDPDDRRDAESGDCRIAGDRGAPPDPTFRVADVRAKHVDSCNRMVDEIFFKRSHYAIYSANGQVLVQYADDERQATKQINDTAELIPLRDKLQFMIAGRHFPGCYRRHIADALRLGLEDKMIVAKETLDGAARDVLAFKARVGRTVYLAFAGPLAFVTFAGLLGASLAVIGRDQLAAGLLLLACAGGTMGALLSIAIALRTRTVAVDDHWGANFLDGAIRLLIGVISAAILFLILNAGFVANIGTDTMRQAATNFDAAWQTALVIGFAAGFFERLVPDLLERTIDQRPKISGSPASK